MLLDVLFYVGFGSAFTIFFLLFIGRFLHGEDAPILFRPEKRNAWFTVLVAAAPACWNVMLALRNCMAV